ncbi:major facilitator superfamily domain-containing protein [Crucibulum laeve]|uniref:Major facilitator superfamily domain-containing protein n=1 Tax=Crucibulum laeve TaxID=68775 RepID=A0A5C3M7M2_9AGAR|nr:major facilitator superfamily domain-containing protein [Crucibulum laeve]
MQSPTSLHPEEQALLPNSHPQRRRSQHGRWPVMRGWKAHPFWLIPVVLVMSMSRGITMAPRIQVYKAIACRVLSDDSSDLVNFLTSADCEKDASVQARAARIQAAVVTTMSVLSAVTTGFWSRLGDAHGRKLILATFLAGALLMEAVFVLVMREGTIFSRYGEHLILVGPIIEGSAGALATFNGLVHAYVSDCTRHGSRSKIFSTIQGIVFIGLAMGPWFGGFLLPSKGYSDRFFYYSMSLIFSTLLYVIFLLPESRQPPTDTGRSYTNEGVRFKTSPFFVIRKQITKFISALLTPIAMFKPRPIPYTSRKNWNMTLVGLGLFLYLLSTGVYSAKYLYAQHVYSWTTAQLGYYMSTLWIARAFNLLVFLPIIISYLKPKSTSNPGSSPNATDVAAELRFDRYLAQGSLGVDGLADALVAITSNKSQGMFVGLSCLSSFTSGGNPALHSLGAVCLHACGHSSEVGTLFGAMAVLSAIAHILSPYIYALTYGSTVAYFPQAIFVFAAALLFFVVGLLSRVHPVEEDISNQMVHTPQVGDEEFSQPLTRGSISYESVPDSPSGPDGEHLQESLSRR